MNKNIFYSLGAVLVWSTLAPVAKMVLNDVPNFEVLFVGAIVAFLFLLVYNIANGSIKTLKAYTPADFVKISGLGFVGMFMSNALYYYGISKMTSQEACIINYLWPIMIMIFSCIILREKITLMKVVAIVCSFLGIVILSFDSIGGGGAEAVWGIIATSLNAVCYGIFSALNKKAAYNQNVAMMVFWFVTAVSGATAGMLTETWVMLDLKQLIGLVWLGIAVKALGYLLWAIGLEKAKDSGKVANLAYLTPFLSIIVAFFLLGEPIKMRALVALVFIVGGILLQYFWDHRKTTK